MRLILIAKSEKQMTYGHHNQFLGQHALHDYYEVYVMLNHNLTQ